MRLFRPWVLTALATIGLLMYVLLVALPAAQKHTHGFASHFTAAYVLVHEPEHMGRVYDDTWFSARTSQLGFGRVADIFNIQPPTMSLIMVPLTGLEPGDARLVWTMLGIVWLLGGLAVLMSALGQAGYWGLWALPLSLGYAPITENIDVGQVYLLIFFLLCLFFWLVIRSPGPLQRRGDLLAGIVLGLLLILKSAGVWLWPLLLLTGRWRMLFWGAVTAIAVALASLPLVGLATWVIYVEKIPAFLVAPQRYVTGYQTVTSLLGHLLVYDATFNPQPLAEWPLLARVATLLILMVALICSLRWGRLSDERHDVRALTLALFLVLAVANAPIGEGYHYTIVLPALIVACWWAWRTRAGGTAWVVLAVAALLIGTPLPYQSPALKASWLALLAYPRVYGAYLLWGWLGWALARYRGTEGTEGNTGTRELAGNFHLARQLLQIPSSFSSRQTRAGLLYINCKGDIHAL
jgi:Glycosyltransferase family 87